MARTRRVRLGFVAFFITFWSAYMTAFSWTRLKSHAILKLCRNEKLDISSDDMKIADLICSSMYQSLFQNFSKYGHYIPWFGS